MVACAAVGHSWNATRVFCSGALMLTSLQRKPQDQRSVVIDRLRRLLVPSAAFLAGAILLSAVLAATTDEARYAVDWSQWPRWLLPWGPPAPSPAIRLHDGHLWFVGTFVAMLLASPALVRLHRRNLALPLAIAFAVVIASSVPSDLLPAHKLGMYAPFFCAGFYYGDGSIMKFRSRWGSAPFLVACAALIPIAIAVGALDSRHPNLSVPSALSVAGAWGALLLAAQPAINQLGRRFNRAVRWVSARTLSIYLVGWPAAQAAKRTTDLVADRGTGVWAALYLLATAVILGVGVTLLHPLERFAQRPLLQHRFQASKATRSYPKMLWAGRVSNPRPSDYESPALTTELPAPSQRTDV